MPNTLIIILVFWKKWVFRGALKDVRKRLSAQYLKEDYAENVISTHLETVLLPNF